MKLHTETRTVETMGTVPMVSTAFTIKTGAHIMKILSGLYSNPVEAIVREYTTNMGDAYVALFKKDPNAPFIPPILSLPNRLDPNITFKDFGIGMSLDTVYKVFMTYGESTKTDNNDEAGGFGLGSKTAFCYNDGQTWTIESRYQGEKHVFSAFISETGIPTATHIATVPSSEPSGVTIQIPILPAHFNECVQCAQNIVPYFPMDIVVNGANIQKKTYDFSTSNFGINFSQTAWIKARHKVIVGGVPYELSSTVIDKCIPYELHPLDIDIFLPIGAIDIVPSRDAIQYTARTEYAIEEAVKNIFPEVTRYIAEKYKSETTYNLWTVRRDRLANHVIKAEIDLRLVHEVPYPIPPSITVHRVQYNPPSKTFGVEKVTELTMTSTLTEPMIDTEDRFLLVTSPKKYTEKTMVALTKKMRTKKSRYLETISTLPVFFISGKIDDLPSLSKIFYDIPINKMLDADRVREQYTTKTRATIKKKRSGVYSLRNGKWTILEDISHITHPEIQYYIPLTLQNGTITTAIPCAGKEFQQFFNSTRTKEFIFNDKQSPNKTIVGVLDTHISSLDDRVWINAVSLVKEKLRGIFSTPTLYDGALASAYYRLYYSQTNRVKDILQTYRTTYGTLPGDMATLHSLMETALSGSTDAIEWFAAVMSGSMKWLSQDLSSINVDKSSLEIQFKQFLEKYPMLQIASEVNNRNINLFVTYLHTMQSIHTTPRGTP